MNTRRKILVAGASNVLALGSIARAQPLSGKPVRIIVPFAAGANSDVLMRALVQQVTRSGGPAFIVENRPGAGGAIAATAVRSAVPDGYTLLLANTGTFAILPAIQRVSYDPKKDFQAITQLFFFSNFLVVPDRVTANSVAELMSLMSKSSKGLSLGSQGVGSPGHLLGAMLGQKAGGEFIHVPYAGGGGPMNMDVMAGRLDMVFSTYASLKQSKDRKQVKFLAVASQSRSELLPHVPTMREAGFSGVELDAWFGLVAPAATPLPIINDLSARFIQAAQAKHLMEHFRAQGVTMAATGAASFTERIEGDANRLAKIAKASIFSCSSEMLSGDGVRGLDVAPENDGFSIKALFEKPVRQS